MPFSQKGIPINLILSMESNDKTDRIVEARMKLKRRFEEKMAQTPSLADGIVGAEKPRGSGPVNRHGMPAVPVGQTLTTKWPVLDLGYQPDIPLDKWQLNIDGEVNHPVRLKWNCPRLRTQATSTA